MTDNHSSAATTAPQHDHRVFFACDCCMEHEPESGVSCRSDIGVMPDGTWLCSSCYSDCDNTPYGMVASDVDDFEFPRFEDLPRPAPYPFSGAAQSPVNQAPSEFDIAVMKERDELRADLEKLKDPVAVHMNMLRGGIAKPSWAAIKHLYPEHFQCSAGRETALLSTLVYEAMRFAIWAAGQGIMPDDGEPAQRPEDFLYEYACAMEIDDWEGLAEVARDHITASPQEARSPADEAEHFIQAAIDSAPEPLRRLGEFLADVLDEDHWKAAERMLLAVAVTQSSWQPIETAPHEEQVLLGWWYIPPWKDSPARWECEVGEASRGWSRNGVSTMSRHGQATHWQPLPSPLPRPHGATP